jgi:hypothetical protein
MIVPIYLNQFDKMGQCYCGILGQAQLNQVCFYFSLWNILDYSSSCSTH